MKNWRYATAGLEAGLAGLGIAHLVAVIVNPGSAPVLVIGSTVVDLTPQPVKQWAIATFGSADKIFLLSVIGVVAALLFAIAGLLARRWIGWGAGAMGVVGAVCIAAALLRPSANVSWAIPSLIAIAVAIGALIALTKALAVAGRNGDGAADPAADRDDTAHRSSRRSFLKLGGAAATVGAVSLLAGQWLIANAQKAVKIALPRAASPLPKLPTGLEEKIPGISAFRTPSNEFYRVDTALVVPTIDPADRSLTIDGDVDNPLVLNFEDLTSYEVIERDITMTCVSNEVGGPYVGAARWLGVRVSDVLADAGVRGGVDQILSRDIDGMTISTPIEALTDDREALLAFGMNGEQLSRERGFPVRLVTPRLYGFVGSTKWLTSLTATTYAKQQAYWTECGWDTDGTIHTQARIDVPKPLAEVTAGEPGFIGGVAWAQGRSIAKVEVKVGDGPWQQATLGADAGIDYWRQWYLPWTPESGSQRLQVRATDGTGAVQTEKKAPPYPSGATGQQSLVVTGV
ncbi:MAG: molybdopterin-dependent oxidoreductase [Cumulibacter sp.]